MEEGYQVMRKNFRSPYLRTQNDNDDDDDNSHLLYTYY